MAFLRPVSAASALGRLPMHEGFATLRSQFTGILAASSTDRFGSSVHTFQMTQQHSVMFPSMTTAVDPRPAASNPAIPAPAPKAAPASFGMAASAYRPLSTRRDDVAPESSTTADVVDAAVASVGESGDGARALPADPGSEGLAPADPAASAAHAPTSPAGVSREDVAPSMSTVEDVVDAAVAAVGTSMDGTPTTQAADPDAPPDGLAPFGEAVDSSSSSEGTSSDDEGPPDSGSGGELPGSWGGPTVVEVVPADPGGGAAVAAADPLPTSPEVLSASELRPELGDPEVLPGSELMGALSRGEGFGNSHSAGPGTEAFTHEHIHSADHILSPGHEAVTLPAGLPRPNHRHHPHHDSASPQHDAKAGGMPGFGEGSFGTQMGHDAGEGAAKYAPHPVLAEILRVSLASQGAAKQLFEGQRAVLGQQRPDLRHLSDDEARLLEELRQLAPALRARPSVLAPFWAAAGFGLGAVTAVVPSNLSKAITGAVQEALTEEYNDQLRTLREAGLSDAAAERVRDLIKTLRDQERAPADAPRAPDITALQHPQNLSPSEAVAAVVKFACRGLFSASSRV